MRSAVLFDAVDGSSNQLSVWYDVGNERGYSISCQASGATLAGDYVLEASTEETDPNLLADPVFAQISSSSTSISNSDDVIFAVSDAEYRWVRLRWTYTSGAGNITSKIQVKEPRRSK